MNIIEQVLILFNKIGNIHIILGLLQLNIWGLCTFETLLFWGILELLELVKY